MKKLVIAVSIIIFALSQATILNHISFFNVKPDLLLISVIMAGLFFPAGWAISFSMLSGVLKDITCVNTFGLYTVLFFCYSLLIIKLSRQISFDNDYVKLALVVIVVLLNDIAIRLTFLFLGNPVSPGIFLRILFIDSLYTAVVFPLVLKLARNFSLINE